MHTAVLALRVTSSCRQSLSGKCFVAVSICENGIRRHAFSVNCFVSPSSCLSLQLDALILAPLVRSVSATSSTSPGRSLLHICFRTKTSHTWYNTVGSGIAASPTGLISSIRLPLEKLIEVGSNGSERLGHGRKPPGLLLQACVALAPRTNLFSAHLLCGTLRWRLVDVCLLRAGRGGLGVPHHGTCVFSHFHTSRSVVLCDSVGSM